jgi:DUF4097 and DUF4098 domain-containing protein YvlB
MYRTLSHSIILTTVAFTLLAGAAVADTIQRGFDVAPGGELHIDSDRGAIEVHTGSDDRVEVEVLRKGDDAMKLDVEFEQRGNDVIVHGIYPKSNGGFRFNWGRGQEIRFRVTVPSRYDVDLKTAGGSIGVDDLEGTVRAETSGGSLSFGRVHGPVWGRTSGGSISLVGGVGDADIRTSGGSIEIGDVDGDVVAETSGGSIEIDRSQGTVHADTSGGGIRVNEVMGTIVAHTSGGSVYASITRQPLADCRLTTSGGGVTVDLGPYVAVELDAASSGGRVTTDLAVDDAVKTRNSLRGSINGGGPSLYLRTSGGGVRIGRS